MAQSGCLPGALRTFFAPGKVKLYPILFIVREVLVEIVDQLCGIDVGPLRFVRHMHPFAS
jgi:hypothetical protein